MQPSLSSGKAEDVYRRAKQLEEAGAIEGAERDLLKGAVTTGAPGEFGKEAAAVTTEAKRPVLDGKSDLAISLLKEYYPDFFGIDDEG